MPDKRKTPPKAAGKKASGKKPKKGSDVKKIYKTTDGMLTNRPDIDKPRRVAAIDQRKDDGALAVVKIRSRKGKGGKSYIKEVVLRPENHTSLTEESIVEKRVYIGVKIKTENGTTFKPIFERDLSDTGDRLTNKEYRKVKKGVSGETKQHKQTYKRKMKMWHNHFKK